MRQSHIYLAIKENKEEYGDPVEQTCAIAGVSRAAYYRWLSGKKYNNRRVQRNLGVLTPMEKHKSYLMAA